MINYDYSKHTRPITGDGQFFTRNAALNRALQARVEPVKTATAAGADAAESDPSAVLPELAGAVMEERAVDPHRENVDAPADLMLALDSDVGAACVCVCIAM